MAFKVYEAALIMIREVRPYRIEIAKEDPNHAEQLRRSSKAVAGNIAEANGSRGRNQQAKFNIALGEARETLAHLEIAVADGIIDAIDPVLLDRCRHRRRRGPLSPGSPTPGSPPVAHRTDLGAHLRCA